MNIVISIRRVLVLGCGVAIGYFTTLVIATLFVKSGFAWEALKSNIEGLPEQDYQAQIMEYIVSGKNLNSICIGDEYFAKTFCEKNIVEPYDSIVLDYINRSVVTKLVQTSDVLGVDGKIYIQTPAWFWTDIADNEFSLNYDFGMLSQALSAKKYDLKNISIILNYFEKSLSQIFERRKTKTINKNPISFINAGYEFPLIKQKYYWNTIRHYSKSSLSDRLVWVGSKGWLPENSPEEIKRGYAEFLSLKNFELGLVQELEDISR